MPKSKALPPAGVEGKHDTGPFAPPLTVSHAQLLDDGGDVAVREALYLMVLTFGRLQTCREAFGRAMGLTGSQFAVLVGTSYRQGVEGVSIRGLAEHIQLASTHVTTEVGRLARKGLLRKTTNREDRRGVLVKLTARGEAAIRNVAPFLRGINDALFDGVSRSQFDALTGFLRMFTLNSERALVMIRDAQGGNPQAVDAAQAAPSSANRRRAGMPQSGRAAKL